MSIVQLSSPIEWYSDVFFLKLCKYKGKKKDLKKNYVFHSKKDTDVYNGLLDSEGEGEGGMIWENGNSNMYTVM